MVYRRIYADARGILGEIIEDMSKEPKLKSNQKNFLADKVRVSNDEILERIKKSIEIFEEPERYLKRIKESFQKGEN